MNLLSWETEMQQLNLWASNRRKYFSLGESKQNIENTETVTVETEHKDLLKKDEFSSRHNMLHQTHSIETEGRIATDELITHRKCTRTKINPQIYS